MSDMSCMSDEEQTAKNGRSSCLPAKGFILLCNLLISMILHMAVFQWLFCCSDSATKDLSAVLSHVSPACQTLLLALLCDISRILPYPNSDRMNFVFCFYLGQPMKCNLHMNGNVITSDQPILL